jgi:pSer/pThr/pTyr-binding forkhead associated (FHA) protein
MGYSLRYHDRTFPLGPTPFTVGRSDGCELAVDHDSLMSRRHATFLVRGELVTVEDLDSRNGVFVNGARVKGVTPVKLGDLVIVGSQEFLLEDGAGNAGNASEDLAVVTLASAPMPERRATSGVDFVTIGGVEYAVLPKEEYLRLEAAADERSPSPTSKQGGRKKKR